MKILYSLVVVCLFACNEGEQTNEQSYTDTIANMHNPTDSNTPLPDIKKEEAASNPSTKDKTYSNELFKEVTVEKTGAHKYTIKGKAQVFEASFSWVVEDGHNELAKGHQMTDAGAPEWGNFNFSVDVTKVQPNSTLTLILFEASAKDGSRQYELPVILE